MSTTLKLFKLYEMKRMKIEIYTTEEFLLKIKDNDSLWESCASLVSNTAEAHRGLTHRVMVYKMGNDEIAGVRYFFYDEAKKVCWLYYLFVTPKFRRSGIAKKLIEETIDHSVNIGLSYFDLVFTSTNVAAPAFYKIYKNLAVNRGIKIDINGERIRY
jgi:GNAT superfamily N-acetyltransferase